MSGEPRDEPRINGSLDVSFSEFGHSASYRVSGWGAQESRCVWAIGTRSMLRLPWPRSSGPLLLELNVEPSLEARLITFQPLGIYANGRFLGTARLKSSGWVACEIPATILSDTDVLELQFEHPGAFRRDFLTASADGIARAVCFYALRLMPAGRSAQRTAGASLLPPPMPAPAQVSRAVRPQAADQGAPMLYRLDLATDRSLCQPASDWYVDEDGGIWTAAERVTLQLPTALPQGDRLLRLRVAPLLIDRLLPAQRITVVVNGLCCGQHVIRAPMTLAIPLPASTGSSDLKLSIEFVMPDALRMDRFNPQLREQTIGFRLREVVVLAVQPNTVESLLRREDAAVSQPALADSSQFLGVAAEDLPREIETVCGAPLNLMMRDFESLGDNCAFGLAQRKAGVEVLGLLRFASSPQDAVVSGLDDEFRVLLDMSEIKLILGPDVPREYLFYIPSYGIRWHTFLYESKVSYDEVLDGQLKKFAYTRRRFYEGLRSGRKIYVIARAAPIQRKVLLPRGRPGEGTRLSPPMARAEAAAVLADLTRFGPNTVLYVVPATPQHPSGSVELLAPGLMRGYLDSFVISNDTAIADADEWFRLAGNAWLLHTGPNQAHRARDKPAPGANN